MLSVEHLSKSFGATNAVADVSFRVEAGEVVGFLGPNGAGKTTTLRMIAGFLGATAGAVHIGGINVAEEPLKALRKLGYMPEQCPAYGEMKVAEYLLFRAALKGVARSARRGQVAEVMALAHVADRRNCLIAHLSKGYRQRLGLADALLGSPELLVLDEPTSGLDPNQVREVRQVIEHRRGKNTVLVSTHVLSEVEATCERAIVIHRGRLVADGTLDELRAERRPKAVDVVLAGHASADPERFLALCCAALSQTPLAEGRVRLRLPLHPSNVPVPQAPLRGGLQRTVSDWVTSLVAEGYQVESVNPVGSSLEDAFAVLTQASLPAPSSSATPGSVTSSVTSPSKGGN